VSTSVDRRFVVVAPVASEHAGAVVVLRRAPVDPPICEAPPLAPRAMPNDAPRASSPRHDAAPVEAR
jgi:hypothetical protein